MIPSNSWLGRLRIEPLILCMFITGCATVAPPPVSGFLENYEDLTVDPNDSSLLWWEVKNFDWRDYNQLMIDPITIMFHPESEGNAIQPERLVELTDSFMAALTEQLGGDYKTTDAPGPGVLRIQAAITDIKTVNAALNVTTALVAFVPVDMGGASMEVRFLESDTGRLLAKGMDQKLGVPTQIRAGFTELGHAKQAANEWAKELYTVLKTNP